MPRREKEVPPIRVFLLILDGEDPGRRLLLKPLTRIPRVDPGRLRQLPGRRRAAVSERTAVLLRSVLASDPFLTWRVVMVFLRMELPSMTRLAWAGPPSATNRATRATTIAGEGRRRVMRM